MIDLLRARRSIRVYEPRPIEPEKIAILKEAALRAPSSRNIDPWEFVFVDDKDLLAQLARCKSHGAGFLADAALAVVVCGDPGASDTWIEDCSIAAILIQLTAQSLGLGSCWVQVRLRAHDQTQSACQYVQRLLGIPEQLQVGCMIAIGYPAQRRRPLAAGELKYYKIHINRFGAGESRS